jgi:hypothetical protein
MLILLIWIFELLLDQVRLYRPAPFKEDCDYHPKFDISS